MRKIAIITIIDYNNYGNRLQNYATQEVLKSIGFNVETVLNNPKSEDNISSKLIKLLTLSPKETYKLLYNKFKNYVDNNNLQKQRIEVFTEFTLENIIQTEFTITRTTIPFEEILKYDYFVTGSDQVWNPYFRGGFSVDFLTFAPYVKRIAYAPSFGISKIPKQHLADYKKWLSEMAHLSVREEAGAKIIKELTGRDALVLIDPTLMLTKEKWLSISKVHSNKPNKKYLLTYFLGGISKEKKKLITTIAEKNNLEIVNLAQEKEQLIYTAGPSEFIDYINSASVLLTDSFHGAVFSILMCTPFIVFNRGSNDSSLSMNSRMDTLLTTFKLESRLAKNIKTNEQIFAADYSHIAPILARERQKALNYLRNAFEIGRKNY